MFVIPKMRPIVDPMVAKEGTQISSAPQSVDSKCFALEMETMELYEQIGQLMAALGRPFVPPTLEELRFRREAWLRDWWEVKVEEERAALTVTIQASVCRKHVNFGCSRYGC